MPKTHYKAESVASTTEEDILNKERLLEDFSDFPPASPPRISLRHPSLYILSKFRDVDSSKIREKLWENLNKSTELLTRNPVLSHASLIAVYSIIFIIISMSAISSKNSHAVIYTPAEAATFLEAKTLSVKINQTSNIFNGDPSPQLDEAWDSLFLHANIRVTKAEIEKLGRPSIELADGSGDYFGSLDVYHQLHCLKYIRQYVHQDYYTMTSTNVPNAEHVDHCIEMLRQVLMCKTDTALMTYEWLPDFPGPWPNFGIQHECVNWEKVDNWSKDRVIDIFDPINLQHPKFGFAYAHLEGLPSKDHERK